MAYYSSVGKIMCWGKTTHLSPWGIWTLLSPSVLIQSPPRSSELWSRLHSAFSSRFEAYTKQDWPGGECSIFSLQISWIIPRHRLWGRLLSQALGSVWLTAFKYLDTWYVGLYLNSCRGPTNLWKNKDLPGVDASISSCASKSLFWKVRIFPPPCFWRCFRWEQN